MGIKIKNLQTGEFEKFNIPALKGEKGEPGEIEPSEKVDYIGKQHSKLRDTMNANVDYIIKTAIGEFNYLDYEGQHIAATNSIEGHARGAILKGQTLVNLVANPTHTFTQTSTINEIWKQVNKYFTVDLQVGKTYIALWDMTWTNAAYAPTPTAFCFRNEDNQGVGRYSQLPSGKYYCKVTIDGSVPTPTMFRFHTSVDTAIENTLTISNFIVLEHQDGMENWDIPYFEGMQSVKMPVLTTIGKNLAHIQPKEGIGYSKNGITVSFNSDKQTILVNGTCNADNTTFYFKDVHIELEEGDVVRGFAECLQGVGGKISFRTNTDGWTASLSTFIERGGITGSGMYTARSSCTMNGHGIRIDSGESFDNAEYRWIVVKNETNTSYEHYKSNILYTPEEVVLRSLPNGICDTLNLNTGEYVQRIGEIVFDGSNDEQWSKDSWWTKGETIGFEIPLVVSSVSAWCNKLCVDMNFNSFVQVDKEQLSLSQEWQVLGIRVLGTKLVSQDVKGLQTYLQSNPITVQYELATPIIKTVDLSDNHVYSYKGTTHYDCSGEEGSLVPTLSVKVPTDTQLTIKEQKATTQTLLIKNMDLQQSIKEVQAMNLAFNTALYNSFNSIRKEVEDIKKHVSTNENLEGSF